MGNDRKDRVPVGRLVAAVAALAVLVAAVTPVGAHVGNGATHLWNSHISKMRIPGKINDGKNPVHWTKLKGVPSGFADGEDLGLADVPGFGLEVIGSLHKGGPTSLHVDSDEVQRRVTGDCPGQHAVDSVNMDGSVDCERIAPVAFEHSEEHVGSINSESLRSVGSLKLDPGLYAIWAKLGVQNSADDTDEHGIYVECELRTGGLVDRAFVWEDETPDPCEGDWPGSLCREGSFGIGANMLPMMLIGGSSSQFEADVLCRDYGTDASGSYLRIMAIPINFDVVGSDR